MITVQGTVLIDRPVDEVFQFVSNGSWVTLWEGGILECTQVGRGRVAAGTTWHLVGSFVGAPLNDILEITAVEAPSRFATRMDATHIKVEDTFKLDSAGTGTKLTRVLAVSPRGIFGLLRHFGLNERAQQQLEADLGRIKHQLEGTARQAA